MEKNHEEVSASPYTLPPPDDLLTRPWTAVECCASDTRAADAEIWVNSRYQVHLRRYEARDAGPPLVHLSFKRLDGRAHIPYRDKMRIKDELVGPKCEGMEL